MSTAEETSGDDAPWGEVTPEAARRLLVAAVDAFAERGYHATTTRDIAGRAGMSPAALYIHYKTKEELLHRISKIGHDRALHLLQAEADGDGTAAERLAGAVRSFVRWHAERHTTARVVQYELDALGPEHRTEIVELRRRSDAVVRGIISEGVRAGSSTSPTSPAPPSPCSPSASTWPAGSTPRAAARPTRSARSTPTSSCGWSAPRRSRRVRRTRAPRARTSTNRSRSWRSSGSGHVVGRSWLHVTAAGAPPYPRVVHGGRVGPERGAGVSDAGAGGDLRAGVRSVCAAGRGGGQRGGRSPGAGAAAP